MLSNYRNYTHRTYAEQIIAEASLDDRHYSYNKIEPGLYFWKQLAATKSHTPRCLIPDTLILNEKNVQALWIYTNPQGHLKQQSNISLKDFALKLTNYSSPNQLVAILKRPIYQENLAYTHQNKLINSRYLINASIQQLAQNNQTICLQRFIKCNGKNPFLCRTFYSRNHSAKCYLITSKRSYFDNQQPENKRMVVKASDKCTIVKSKTGKNLTQTMNSLQQIVKYLQFFRGIQITDLVGDFLKDQVGNWWLINVKAFKILQKPKNSIVQKIAMQGNEEIEKQRYQKTKMCRYCEKNYLQSQLTHRMTMRMIIEVDKYLVHLGKWNRWLRRSDIANVDAHCLYQQHKTCERCYKLYEQIQSIMEVQTTFLEKLGCQLQSSPKQLIKSETNEAELWSRAKNKQIHKLAHSISSNLLIELGPSTNIAINDSIPIKNDEITNEMVRIRFILYLHEIDQVMELHHNFNYYLEHSLFGKKTKYKLNTMAMENGVITLKKLKVMYFFAGSIAELENYANKENAAIRINLITQNVYTSERSNIGRLSLAMKDYISCLNSKKNFYKFLEIDGLPYGWGLQGSIGILASQGHVNTSRMIFQKTQGEIYIPNDNYYFCQHLPEQWIDHIQTKHQQLTRKGKARNKMATEVSQLDQMTVKGREVTVCSEEETTQVTWKDVLNMEIENYLKPKGSKQGKVNKQNKQQVKNMRKQAVRRMLC